MGKIGYGYGSEWQLLRYLGRHRRELNRAVEGATSGPGVDWLDFRFNPKARPFDAEWKGLDFLDDALAVKTAWRAFWPQTGNVPNWDAVGWLQVDSHVDLLLVEAKAHIGELKSACKAKPGRARQTIESALDEAKAAFGVPPGVDWLSPYYQYCNRLATLNFLLKHNVSARLLFIYFLGDTNPHADCPGEQSGWQDALDDMHAHVGLTGSGELVRRIHTLFLPVCPKT